MSPATLVERSTRVFERTHSALVDPSANTEWQPALSKRRWFTSVVQRVNSFVQLPQNWDSYGGGSVSVDTVSAATLFLALIEMHSVPLPRPAVAPASAGGIQLEWAEGDLSVEVEFLSNGDAEYVVARGGNVIDHNVATPDHFQQIVRILAATIGNVAP